MGVTRVKEQTRVLKDPSIYSYLTPISSLILYCIVLYGYRVNRVLNIDGEVCVCDVPEYQYISTTIIRCSYTAIKKRLALSPGM